MLEANQFFTGEKCMLTLMDVKPKLNQQNDRRIRFDFAMPLTAKILESAPQDVKDAFYAVVKDGGHLNPIGISARCAGKYGNGIISPVSNAAAGHSCR
jgi:hypothetical protein